MARVDRAACVGHVGEGTYGVREAVADALKIDAALLGASDVSIESRSFEAGEVLVKKGDPVDGVFVILDGSVRVLGFDEQVLAELDAGAVVGEVAVLAGGTRTATISAVVPTEVAFLDAGSFERLVEAAPELYERVSTEAIRRLDHRWLMEFIGWLLGPVDPQVGDAISQWVTWRRLKAGEHLYQRGDPATGGYTVIRGRIRITGPDDGGAAGPGGYEVGKGALIGEEGLVSDLDRRDSALAVRDSVVVEVPRPAFLALLETQPKVVASVLANLMRQQAQRKNRSSRQAATAVLSVDRAWLDRVCTALRRRLEAFGTTSWISSDRTDGLLGKEGVAQSPTGTPGDVRLSQLLHEMEHESAHMLYEADPEASQWTGRVVRQADAVVIAVPADAAEEDLGEIDEALRFRSLGTLILAVFHPDDTLRPLDTARLVGRWEPDATIHLRGFDGPDMERLARVVADRANGLVLGGGGARGFAHLGVWRALLEHGIDVDFIGGASMGAAMGAMIARGGEIDELEHEVRRAFRGIFDYTIPLVALVKGKRVAKRLTATLGDWDIEDLWVPYFCTSTNLTHSQIVVHDRGDLVRAVRASVAIPGVLPPVSSASDLLVDSGILNNLPADIMRRRVPNGTVIAVDVAPPVGPRARHDFGMSVSAWQVLRSKLRRRGRNYPRLSSVLLRSMITASARERDRHIDSGVIDLYLDLDMRGIGLLDFDRAVAVMRAGYEASAPRIEQWLAHAEA